MSEKRKRVIREFVNNRVENIERETGRPVTAAELKDAHEVAESRVDTYLEGWTGNN